MLRQILSDGYHLLRLSAFGATAVLPLLGAAGSSAALGVRRVAGLLGVAGAFHAWAYLDNDLCDLEIDRSQPLRAHYPLVRGALRPGTARRLAFACVPLAFGLDALIGVPEFAHRRRMQLGAAFVLLAIYNRWGKTCPLPPLTDGLQALGWAALIDYGAAASGNSTSGLTHLLKLYEITLIMLVNGVHGALRDLANDQACGARTTAIWLGARVDVDGRLHLPLALVGYSLILQSLLVALPIHALWASMPGQRGAAQVVAASGVITTSGLALALLLLGAQGKARPSELGMLHLILILSTPVALVAPGMAPAPRTMLLLAHLLPLLSNGMTYAALRWALVDRLA